MKAQLHIETALRNGKTILKNVFHSHPFKLANITEDKTQSTLRLMMMSSSPGILDGDEYEIKIDIGENCLVELETQSYQRLFNMKHGAVQQIEVKMKQNASLTFLPHPSVPHESSIFKASNKVFLSAGYKLAWGEVLTCGRKLSGEVFLFSKYHNLTEIYLNNKLAVKENLLMAPQLVDVNKIGQLEGYTHQASFICIDERLAVNDAIEKAKELLQEEKEICYGVSLLPVNGFIVRILGYKGEQLHTCLKNISHNINQTVEVYAK